MPAATVQDEPGRSASHDGHFSGYGDVANDRGFTGAGDFTGHGGIACHDDNDYGRFSNPGAGHLTCGRSRRSRN